MTFPVRAAVLLIVLAISGSCPGMATVLLADAHGFHVEHEVRVAVPPEVAYDRFTGDVSPWWDHHFSEQPHALVIEPEIGGRFYEEFDAEGNGVRHATVIAADRGRLLRMQGALGLAGYPLEMVHTLRFSAVEGGTRVTLEVRAWGVIEEGWATAIDAVWRHFLVERYKPWAEGRLKTDAPESSEQR